VFQPHRFTRSKNLAQQFPPSFINADEIILAPIYTANEKPIAGIGLDYLNRFFKNRYDERKLKCIGEFSEIQQYLRDSLQPGDVIMTVGAGDVYKIGHALASYLHQQEQDQAESVDLDRIEQSLAAGSSLFPDDEGAALR
jgi:UDP-N-acetylmuramate--alanine ligase